MNFKKIFKKSDLTITIILIIGILIVINFLSYQIFHRWDLTENKVFSISDISKKTVENLDDVVNIKAYFSDNLPSQFLSVKQEVGDILDEYQSYSNGKVRVEFINPGDDEDTLRELYMMGIPQLSFQVYEKDKAQLINGYMGMAVSYGDKTEVIPAITQDTRDLEYQITTKIKKVTSDEIATVGFVTNLSTLDQEEMTIARRELEELYTIRDVELAGDVGVEADIDTLVMVGPKKELSEEQMKSLNSFLMRGGSLFVMVDGVTVEQGLQAQKNTSNIFSFLNNYGIDIHENLVADLRSGVASFSQGFVTFSTNYPFWPKITSDGFSQDNVTVSSLENVVLPWASSIEVNGIDESAYSYLAKTSEKAWTEEDNFMIAPNSVVPSPQTAQYNLIVSVNGAVNNAYKNDENPEEKINAKIIAIGDSDFVSDGFIQSNPDNLNLFLNLVDSLSFDEDIIKIRSKNVSSRPIEENLEESTKAFIKYINVFGITILVIIFGMVRYYLRRRSKFIDEI